MILCIPFPLKDVYDVNIEPVELFTLYAEYTNQSITMFFFFMITNYMLDFFYNKSYSYAHNR